MIPVRSAKNQLILKRVCANAVKAVRGWAIAGAGFFCESIRVHRSTIININYLKEIEKHFNGGMIVKMQTGKSFPVSRTHAKVIRRKVV